jgi:hypothetical protein
MSSALTVRPGVVTAAMRAYTEAQGLTKYDVPGLAEGAGALDVTESAS